MAGSRRIYTRSGDDGTTGLLFGGRVAKDSALPAAYGTVDEAQAVLGLARVHAIGENERLLIPLMRDLWVLMAELATAPENRSRLEPGVTAVTEDMVRQLEQRIDVLEAGFEHPTEFVVPGGTSPRRGSTSPARWCAGPSGSPCPRPRRRRRSCPTSTGCPTCSG